MAGKTDEFHIREALEYALEAINMLTVRISDTQADGCADVFDNIEKGLSHVRAIRVKGDKPEADDAAG